MNQNLRTLQLAALQLISIAVTTASQALPALISSTRVTSAGTVIFTTPENLRALTLFLQKSTASQCTAPIELAVTDRLGIDGDRFDLTYQYHSPTLNLRPTVVAPVSETESVPSLAVSSPATNWEEREAHNMNGIHFSGHPNLSPILTDYGFSGHPLRKEQPLTGYEEVNYDNAAGRVVSSPVELAQEFRVFSTLGRPAASSVFHLLTTAPLFRRTSPPRIQSVLTSPPQR